jgi:hemerythrin-like domain-containing protein
MKTATKNLEDDHVHILLLTDVMEHITSSGKPDVSHLEMIVDIIRNFADGLHHAKEENLFFPFLGTRGFSSSQGPVAVMLHEHVLGRNYVKNMSESIALYKSGNESAAEDIFRNMNGYAELLRSHIAKENNILFRMADGVLSEADNNSLLESFAGAEEKHSVTYGKNDYAKQIEDLANYYEISNN